MAGIFENLRKALKSNPYERSSEALDRTPPKKKKTELQGLGGAAPTMVKSHELQGGVSQEDDSYIRRSEEKARKKLQPKAYTSRY
jgi:hypothetical protein